MPKMNTTWGSRNAEDLFKIATRIAGFDSKKLMLAIHRRQRNKRKQVNMATVEAAMQELKDNFERTGEQ